MDDKNSLLAQHWLQNNHEFDFNDANQIQLTITYTFQTGIKSWPIASGFWPS